MPLIPQRHGDFTPRPKSFMQPQPTNVGKSSTVSTVKETRQPPYILTIVRGTSTNPQAYQQSSFLGVHGSFTNHIIPQILFLEREKLKYQRFIPPPCFDEVGVFSHSRIKDARFWAEAPWGTLEPLYHDIIRQKSELANLAYTRGIIEQYERNRAKYRNKPVEWTKKAIFR